MSRNSLKGDGGPSPLLINNIYIEKNNKRRPPLMRYWEKERVKEWAWLLLLSALLARVSSVGACGLPAGLIRRSLHLVFQREISAEFFHY